LRVKVASDGSGTARLDLGLPAGAVVERESGPAPSAARSVASARAAQAPAPEVDLDRQGATFALSSGTRTYVIRPAAAVQERSSPASPDDEAPVATKEPTGSGQGGTGSLPFTGFVLLGLLLSGLALLGGGRVLRRRFGTGS